LCIHLKELAAEQKETSAARKKKLQLVVASNNNFLGYLIIVASIVIAKSFSQPPWPTEKLYLLSRAPVTDLHRVVPP